MKMVDVQSPHRLKPQTCTYLLVLLVLFICLFDRTEAESVIMQPSSASSNPNGFVHRSAVATSPHDPHICLGSHCIRSAFGETVQLVADSLQTRGPLTFKQISSFIREKNRSITTPSSSIRASLLVLLQHSLCTVDYRRQKGVAFYVYHPDQAVYILRFAKFIEWTRKTVDATAACVVETLLLAGRLRTTDVVLQAASIAPKSDRYTARETVLEAFYKLVQAGFLHQVPELKQDEDEEVEWGKQDENGEDPPKKKVKIEKQAALEDGEDPAIISILKANSQYRSNLPIDAVWRVNIALFHESLRAYTLGKLVAERYGHKIQSCGSMVTAALRYRSYLRHSVRKQDDEDMGEEMTFGPEDIIRYLPKPVLQLIEKKTGGVAFNLSKAFQDLSELENPEVVRRVGDDHFEVKVRSLAEYLHDRIIHKVVCDRCGETAGRVISVLSVLGWLESDKIAEHAMVPARDTRELLHQLLRKKYVELFSVSAARMPTPINSIYVWRADRDRLVTIVTENTALALWNIRLRRQHQVEVGKEWIERAQQAGDMDENDHETDRINYQRFCVGLERLDNAVLQLDETLMVLKDF
jgi:hypothetical protein